MKFGFFLKHVDFQQLIADYNPTASPGKNKGIVILLKVVRNSSGGLDTEIKFRVVEGNIDPQTGEVPDIAGSTARTPCPYPPPCTKLAEGTFILDKSSQDVGCYE